MDTADLVRIGAPLTSGNGQWVDPHNGNDIIDSSSRVNRVPCLRSTFSTAPRPCFSISSNVFADCPRASLRAQQPPHVEVVMLDPFPPAPTFLAQAIRPLSDRLGLATLPLHVHEIIFSYALYEFIFRLASPALSRFLWPRKYAAFRRRDRLNWDAHVVSMYQALFINAAALWCIFADPARAEHNEAGNWAERLWGYNGAAGMCQAFAAGYFVWDVVTSALHVDVMGASSLVHAVAALGVTCIGFRPFANYYGLNFVLYELSTPFLNIHWFMDKAGMTGTTAQLINGILLLASFAGCRLVWGSYQSWMIYRDIWRAWHNPQPGTAACVKYAGLGMDVPPECRALPGWLALLYVGANTALTVLNFWWYNKMIAAVRKRFVPKEEGKSQADGKKER